MRFTVRRTSQWGDKQPCEEAELHEVLHEPIKHVRDQGNLGRVYPVWTIKINSLKQLVEFAVKYGNIIVIDNSEPRDYGPVAPYRNMPEIEIYDGYRE